MTELQNDRQDKNNMPPDLRSRGHKKAILNKNIGIIGHFLKDRDFIGNIGTLEGLCITKKLVLA